MQQTMTNILVKYFTIVLCLLFEYFLSILSKLYTRENIWRCYDPLRSYGKNHLERLILYPYIQLIWNNLYTTIQVILLSFTLLDMSTHRSCQLTIQLVTARIDMSDFCLLTAYVFMLAVMSGWLWRRQLLSVSLYSGSRSRCTSLSSALDFT